MQVNKIQTNNLKNFITESNPSQKQETTQNTNYNQLTSFKSSLARTYFPNIRTMSSEEKFDIQYDKATELSDGTKLIRPTVLNTGSTEIKPSKKAGFYDVIFTSFSGGYKHEPTIKTISEDELKSDKYLYAGQIKQIGDNKYEIKYLDDSNKLVTKTLSKEECIEIMKMNCSHF